MAAISAAALAPGESQAGPKRQTVDASFAVKLAQGAGSVTSASIAITFPLPSGISAGKGCKGQVAASAKVGTNTRAWSGKLKADGASCVATINAKLAKSALGKTVSFTFTFDGNAKLAPFKTKKKLLIVTAAPPQPTLGGNVPAPATTDPTPSPAPPAPTPTSPAPTTPTGTTPPAGPPVTPIDLYSKGKWGTDPSPEHGIQFRWTVLSDGTIPGMQASTFKWNCGTELSPDVWVANLRFDGGLSATIDGSVEGSYHYLSDDGKTNVTYTAKFKMTDNTVSGNMTAAGTYDYGVNGGGIKGCHTTETFTGYHIP